MLMAIIKRVSSTWQQVYKTLLKSLIHIRLPGQLCYLHLKKKLRLLDKTSKLISCNLINSNPTGLEFEPSFLWSWLFPLSYL